MSYSGDPSNSSIDAVRFWAQDTGTPGLLSDGEIQYLSDFSGLDLDSAPIAVAAMVAERIGAKYAGEVSISSDGVTYSGDQLQQKYSTLAVDLRKQSLRISASGSTPVVGGLRREGNFAIGQDDNPEGYSQHYRPYWADGGWDPLDGRVGY